jgi:endonuclease/exonuclease/phosphatase family metal-dependent hydrolase
VIAAGIGGALIGAAIRSNGAPAGIGSLPTREASGGDPDPNTLRVVTYNVRYLVGEDGGAATKEDVKRVVDQVQKLKPDVLLLQEVRDFSIKGSYRDQPAELAAALEPTSVAWAPRYRNALGAAEGVAVLTFHDNAITDARSVRLPQTGSAKRAVMDTMVRTGTGEDIRVLSAHLSYDRGYDKEFDALLSTIDADKNSVPSILGGDFNVESDGRRGASERNAMSARGLQDATAAAGAIDDDNTSFHSRPGVDIDRIYARGLTLIDARIVDGDQQASDHLPVVADYRLDA